MCANVVREDFTEEVKTCPSSVGGGEMERLFQVRGISGQKHEDGNKLGMCRETEEYDLTGAVFSLE